jgi:beta-lactamase regulating signal transducer with metallopeptidase domain/uncharacterized GH25 family protein/thiol-disulfide isomerase/thioredoxin
MTISNGLKRPSAVHEWEKHEMTTQVLEHYPLVNIAIRSLVILGITFAVAITNRRGSAAANHRIWVLGFCGCLVIPFVTLLSPNWKLPVLPPASSLEAISATTAIQYDALAGSDVNRSQPETVPRTPSSVPRSHVPQAKPASQQPTVAYKPAEQLSLARWAFIVWCLGMASVVSRHIQQALLMRRSLAQCNKIECDAWCNLRDTAAQQLGLRRKVELKSHPDAVSPMVVGALRPVVLLPTGAEAWTLERKKQVLLHELAHVQRRDVLTQSIAGLACAMHWFNPLAWWGASEMKRLREIACDDAVVTHTAKPSSYAQTLLDVAKTYRCRQHVSAVAMARTSNVESRIGAILDATRRRAMLSKRSARIIGAAALVLSALVGSLQLSSRADEQKNSPPEREVTSEKASEARTMAIRVLDASGRPISQASVLVSIWEIGDSDNFPTRTYTTNDQGNVDIAIPHRLHILRIWPDKAGYVPQFVNFAEGTHEEGQLIPSEYEFRLQRGSRLSGVVVDSDGKPIANAKVQVKVEVEEPFWGANPKPMISTWLANGGDAAVTNQHGQWEITNAPALKPGTDFQFQLQVTHPDFAGDTRWGELQKQQGITTEDLRTGNATLTLDRGLVISGGVVGPEGRPVTNGWVVWNDEPYFFRTPPCETRIDAEGRFRTPPLPAGEYPITVIAPGYAAERRMVTAEPGMEELKFKLKAGNRIVMRFVDADGAPVPGAGVYLGNSSGANTWNNTNALHNQTGSNVPNYGIPRKANDQGVYVWEWAPEGAVKYDIGAKGFAPQELSLVPKAEPHVITLAPQRVVVGTVTDASTGKPIERFLTMPVIVFRPDFYHTRTTDAETGKNGQYELPLTGSGDPNDRYRVRFEAEGYRSVVSEESFGPLDGRVTLDIALEPAPARHGRVLDANGKPVENAMVLQASPTEVPDISNGIPESYDSRPILTDAQGNFQLRATTEPVLVRVYHDLGFAEKALTPDEAEAGTIKLDPWATVSGRLMQAGRAVADQSIYFRPLVNRGLTEARFQDSFYAATDKDGSFQFDRVPPIRGTLSAYLGPWQDSPLSSSEAVSLELRPGEHREVALGGEGAIIHGRVVATGRSNEGLSKQWSLNYLVSRSPGVAYPEEAQPLSFDPNGNLQPAWLRQPDFQEWVATRRNYFVKLSEEGRLQIHGVKPGEYDLVIQLYEQPAGCLVETIGEKVVPVTVTEDDVAAGEVAIGDIEVECRIGPRVGSDMRAFQFTDAEGRVRYVDDMKGRYVLFHVWASWCQPCLVSMPEVKSAVERHAGDPLTVVGLNIDEDNAAAKKLVQDGGWSWAQNYLGDHSDMMRQLGISSVPAYYLIGANGKLVGSANEWEQMKQLLSDELR